MLPKSNEACTKCGGWGIEWNDKFDRKIDNITDTQGLSIYDSVNQLKTNPQYRNDYWTCNQCNGSGKKD